MSPPDNPPRLADVIRRLHDEADRARTYEPWGATYSKPYAAAMRCAANQVETFAREVEAACARHDHAPGSRKQAIRAAMAAADDAGHAADEYSDAVYRREDAEDAFARADRYGYRANDSDWHDAESACLDADVDVENMRANAIRAFQRLADAAQQVVLLFGAEIRPPAKREPDRAAVNAENWT